MDLPHTPSRGAQWHYECVTAEVELLRHENRQLRQVIQTWREVIAPEFESIRRAFASLEDSLASPCDTALLSKSLASPLVADRMYRMPEAE